VTDARVVRLLPNEVASINANYLLNVTYESIEAIAVGCPSLTSLTLPLAGCPSLRAAQRLELSETRKRA